MTEVILTDKDGKTLRAGIDVGGIVTPDAFIEPGTNQQIFDALQHFRFRKDDIMLCTFPKSGTTWMFELLSIILNKSAKRIPSLKSVTMIECQTQENIDKITSPRVINSHLRPSLFPKDLGRNKTKTILCVRNPKDVATSIYHHMVGLSHYGYTGTFTAWLPLYLEGRLEDGKYTDYLLDWERLIEKGLKFPLHLMYYENLNLDTEKEVDMLLEFLELDMSQELKKEIINACSFKTMAKEKQIVSKEVGEKVCRNNFSVFRKGTIGDWKNQFTVAQNEMFESIWKKEMKDSKLFDYIYSYQENEILLEDR